MWGLGLELPGLGLGLGFYDKVSVSTRNLSQVSVSEVTVSTTSLPPSNVKRAISALFSTVVVIINFWLAKP